MASPDAGGSTRQPHVPMEVDRHSPSSISSALSDRGHGPSHNVERAPPDEPQVWESDVSSSSEEDSEEGSEDTFRPRYRAPQWNVSSVDEATDPSLEARRATGEGPERGISGPSSPSAAVLVGDHPHDIRPGAESGSPEATENHRGSGVGSMPTSPDPGSTRRSSGVLPEPEPSMHINTRLAPGPSPSPSTAAEHTSPSEIVLPRWQPDSEVTYCPFCGTQFSFFVRKHHCRLVFKTAQRSVVELTFCLQKVWPGSL
jgi:hypothetical protein